MHKIDEEIAITDPKYRDILRVLEIYKNGLEFCHLCVIFFKQIELRDYLSDKKYQEVKKYLDEKKTIDYELESIKDKLIRDKYKLSKYLRKLISLGFVSKTNDGKYFLREYAMDFESYYVNKEILEDQINKLDFKYNSIDVVSNIHVFSFDKKINELIQNKEEYKQRFKKIKNKLKSALRDLNQLRHDIFVNEIGSGFFPSDTGFSGYKTRKKTNITVIMHTFEDIIETYFDFEYMIKHFNIKNKKKQTLK